MWLASGTWVMVRAVPTQLPSSTLELGRRGTELISGNLHLNIIAKEFKDEVRDAIEPYVYELVGKSKTSGWLLAPELR